MKNREAFFKEGIQMLKSDSEAVLRYRSGDFEIVMPGTYVRCAVTGERILLEDLRYWSFDRQEAYLSSEVATGREGVECGERQPAGSLVGSRLRTGAGGEDLR